MFLAGAHAARLYVLQLLVVWLAIVVGAIFAVSAITGVISRLRRRQRDSLDSIVRDFERRE